MVAELKMEVKWLSKPDAEERLRRVYDLLLRDKTEQKPAPQSTILELLRRAFDFK